MQERIGGFELEFCRGVEGKCPQALVLDGPNLLARIKNIVRTSSWGQEKDLKKHHLFKIGFSACPNACARSQIKDVGFIGRAEIKVQVDRCVKCGLCLQACKEQAILLEPGLELTSNCLGCGECALTCEQEALSRGETQVRVLLGGRLGRHARLAKEVDRLSLEKMVSFLAFVLKLLERSAVKQGKELFTIYSPQEIRDGFSKQGNNSL